MASSLVFDIIRIFWQTHKIWFGVLFSLFFILQLPQHLKNEQNCGKPLLSINYFKTPNVILFNRLYHERLKTIERICISLSTSFKLFKVINQLFHLLSTPSISSLISGYIKPQPFRLATPKQFTNRYEIQRIIFYF